MRHQDVSIASLSLTLALVGACALFAGRRPAPGAASPEAAPSESETVERLYARLCADCHDAEEFSDSLRAAPDRGLSALDMLDFLAVHGGATDAEDRALVRWFCAPEAR